MALDLFKLGGWKRRTNRNGVAQTATYNPQMSTQTLSMPGYQEHMRDLYRNRLVQDSRSIMKEAFKSDPDVSAAVNAYLTVANTEPVIMVRDEDGNLDREGYAILQQILRRLTIQTDYSGFQLKPSLGSICADMRYMLLLRGAIGTELVFDRTYAPSEIRHVDMASIRWKEAKPGQYKPVQTMAGSGAEVPLDIPTFFVSFFRRDPTSIYTTSHFVASINTIAARQQVINDLYRIMTVTGFPRIDITVLEEVLINGAPAAAKETPEKQREWVRDQVAFISRQFGNLRADQAFVHTDSTEAKIINERNPAAGLDISKVVDVLNGQNQAALKTMATIIGRGESGVNTASVEARVFSMNADELNGPVAENLSQMLTFALAMQGRAAYVEVTFRSVELRPKLELESHMSMKQARLLQALSLGLISDDEYHMEMHGRFRPEGTPELSGTGFMNKSSIQVDATKVSPNADPLGRGLVPDGGNMVDSNTVQSN